MNNGESEGSGAIRAGVARYLREHPQARDTPAGIAHWWLAPSGVLVMTSVVEAVLEHMAEAGELRRTELPDGQRLYGRAD